MNKETLSNILNHTALIDPSYHSHTGWTEHAPFAFYLIELLRPKILVELGAYYGYSYFAFCQAVKHNKLNCQTFAIDTWQGDEHAGFYGNEVFDQVSAYNQQNYSNFSKLIRNNFSAALEHFADKSIDLLHIDGSHFYKDVKEDFETWKPKLSDNSIVLFHDTNYFERDFGVHQLWAELREQYQGFQFPFGYGLGVLATGKNLSKPVQELLNACQDATYLENLIKVYERFGKALQFDLHFASLAKRNEQLEQNNTELLTTRTQQTKNLADAATKIAFQQNQIQASGQQLQTAQNKILELQSQISGLENNLQQSENQLENARLQMQAMLNSKSWKLTEPLRRLKQSTK